MTAITTNARHERAGRTPARPRRGGQHASHLQADGHRGPGGDGDHRFPGAGSPAATTFQIGVPASASVGEGTTSISGQLGNVRVTGNRGLLPGTWTATITHSVA
jgi:hypothetical protein